MRRLVPLLMRLPARPRARPLALLALVAALALPARADTRAFAAGSLIVPMDVGDPASPPANLRSARYQNYGLLRAFGLVHALLKQGVRVHWVVLAAKPAFDSVDMTVEARFTPGPGSGAGTAHDYRAGPFVVDAADADAARAVITDFNAGCSEDAAPFCVHTHESAAGWSANVVRSLLAAPTIGVMVDGNEDVAFRYLNAAGILTSLDTAWPDDCSGAACDGIPEVLEEASVAGCPGAADPGDTGCTPDGLSGSLFDAEGDPNVCQLMTMHYVSTAWEPHTQAAVLSYLDGHPTHFFSECDAGHRFENQLRLLTLDGIDKEGKLNSDDEQLNNHSPFAQSATVVRGGGGSMKRWSVLGAGYRATTEVHAVQPGQLPGVSDLWATGPALGDPTNGKVSMLGGHDYCIDDVCVAAARAQGEVAIVRYFLNSLFEAPCATAEGQGVLDLTKTGPATVDGATQITWTIDLPNVGAAAAKNVVVVDTLPVGTTFVSATGGGSYDASAHQVTWSLGRVDVGDMPALSVTADVVVEGDYDNRVRAFHRVALTTLTVRASFTTSVVNLPPPPPVIDSPSDGALIGDDTPTLTGTAQRDATITVLVDGVSVGMTTADASGSWSFTLDPGDALAQGDYALTAVATDDDGDSAASTPVNITVDLTPPAVPSIASPADGTITNVATLDVSGTAEPGDSIDVYVDGAVVASTTADGAGSWSVTLPAVSEATHLLQAEATDGLSRPSGLSAPTTVTVDVTAPAAPTILSPADGSTTIETEPTVTGTAEPGAIVSVLVDGVAVADVIADVDGGWSYTLLPGEALGAGAHTVSAIATDLAGNGSDAGSSSFTVGGGVDTTAPDTLISSGPPSPTADPTALFTFSSSEVGSTFECSLDGGAYVACTSPRLLSMLTGATHAFRVRATDAAGNTDPTPAVWVWVVDPTFGMDAGVPPDGGQNDGGQNDGGQNDGGQNDGGQNDGGQNDGGQNDGGVLPDGAVIVDGAVILPDSGVGDGGVLPDGAVIVDGAVILPDSGVGDGGVLPDGAVIVDGAVILPDSGVGDGGDADGGGADGGGADGGVPQDGAGRDVTLPAGTCGNGLVEQGETCDDGNFDDGDGCADDCAVERGYVCDDFQPSLCVEVDDYSHLVLGGGGCGCSAAGSQPSWLIALGLLALSRARRRRG